jgi:hypothetical protein
MELLIEIRDKLDSIKTGIQDISAVVVEPDTLREDNVHK